MPTVFWDAPCAVSTGQTSHSDLPLPAERLHRACADRALAVEWSGPKALPPMAPALDWTVASTRQQVQDDRD